MRTFGATLMLLAVSVRGYLAPQVVRSSRTLTARASTAAVELTSDTDNKFESWSAKTAFMFPGQGAQVVGMAKDVCEEVRCRCSQNTISIERHLIIRG